MVRMRIHAVGKGGGALGSQRFKSLMVAPPGQELRQCLSPAPGQLHPRLHEYPACWWGLCGRGGSMLCLACGAYITSQGLTQFCSFLAGIKQPFLGIGSPYLMCLTQNCCLKNVKTCNFQYTLVCHLQDTMRKTNHQ